VVSIVRRSGWGDRRRVCRREVLDLYTRRPPGNLRMGNLSFGTPVKIYQNPSLADVYTSGTVTYSRQQPTFRVVMLVVLTTVALLVTSFVPFSALPIAAHVPSGHTDCAYHPAQTVIADCDPAIGLQGNSSLHCLSLSLVFLFGIPALKITPRSRDREADGRLYPRQARPALFQRPPPSLSFQL
jgi:hypothetical protein